jgi:hypothetical protein
MTAVPRLRCFAIVILTVLSLPIARAASSAQGGITGAWDIVVNAPDGAITLYAEFTQKDKIVSGTVYNANAETKVTGTMDGNTLKVEIYISGVTIQLTGELKADGLSGKAVVSGAGDINWTGTRAKN